MTKNALKFSQGHDIKIKAMYDAVKQLLRVYVVDKGKGIKPDEMDKLFTLFGKIERTSEENVEGIGMGLTIC